MSDGYVFQLLSRLSQLCHLPFVAAPLVGATIDLRKRPAQYPRDIFTTPPTATFFPIH
ncbi:hypothetical protein EDC26_11246 [Paralcaligenes ureilyticus]|uniref:Uncharacterized protein n=1 Tax=Paralcaligenes ureilyticus TaxID=627131 RepID=A0A4R3LV81_9BURK|nr:hypothetical protein EDC26_11246 [Paralcaligenes ureilyticus]